MKLSANFSVDEFACHDGQDVPEQYIPYLRHLVVDVLQPIRDQWGSPIVVISGWRSAAWNTAVGGAPKSTHLTAQGADIRPVQVESVPLLYAVIEKMYEQGRLPGLGGIGKYRGWTHVDTRRSTDGHLRRWAGKGVGSER